VADILSTEVLSKLDGTRAGLTLASSVDAGTDDVAFSSNVERATSISPAESGDIDEVTPVVTELDVEIAEAARLDSEDAAVPAAVVRALVRVPEAAAREL
jgi:hypothetical protein